MDRECEFNALLFAPNLRMPILVVDDNKVSLTVMENQLRRMGFARVVGTLSHVEARELLGQTAGFGLLITDLMMPDLQDGFNFIRHVRSRFSSEQLPMMVITSSSEHTHMETAFRLGVNEYLVKPIATKELGERLDTFQIQLLKRDVAFAKFLVEEGFISSEEMWRALSLQRLLGHLSRMTVAMAVGDMPESTFWTLMREYHMDETSFLHAGEKVGLSAETVKKIAGYPLPEYRYFGEILITMKFLSEERLNHARRKFEQQG
jgi:CheY-like chemotaxis protein